jgi:thiosulfate/3-mercaptopyruvate sulfurtransferase
VQGREYEAAADSDDCDALVTPTWLDAHRNDPLLKIVEIAGTGQEDLAAYKAGHVPGAACWWWMDALWHPESRDFPSREQFARDCAAAGISDDTTVVFYGEPVQFGIYAWWVFRYCGHRKVRVLDGARYRWAAEGRALAKDDAPPRGTAGHYTPRERDETMRIRRDDVLAALGRSNHLILDARTPEEYDGLRVNGPTGPDVGALRYGRIPGAKHLFFEGLLTADKSFKPVNELRSMVLASGASADKDIIAYCRMSHRATVLYFVLTQLLKHEKVRVYDGSWTEWGNLVGVPIER